MIFTPHILDNFLDGFVEAVFHFSGFNPDHSIERVVPTGHIFVIFELDDMTRHTYDNQSLKPNGSFSNVWISGNHNNYLSISAHQNSEMLVVQLKPSGFYPIIQQPVAILNNRVIDAKEIFGTSVLELREEIKEDNDILNKFKRIEAWLKQRVSVEKVPDEELNNTLQELNLKPFVNHADIISAYPRTQKTLIHQFKKYYGLTPKVLHRVYRFNQILQEIHTKKRISWSEITYQFGYADQSHFIKEFKEFSGFNPQEFITSDYHNDQTNFFPLDKKG